LIEKMLASAESSVAGLPPIQRERIMAAGGPPKAFAEYEHLRVGLSILRTAHDMLSDSEEEEEDPVEPLSEEEEIIRLGRKALEAKRRAKERQEREREIEATERDLKRLHEALTPLGLVAPLQAADTTAPVAVLDGITLSEAFEKWLKHKKQRPDTERKWRVYVRRFREVHGDLSVDQITKAHVRDYVDAIAALPDSRGLKPELRRGTVQGLMAWLDDEPDAEVVSAATVTKHLDCIKALLRWCARQGYVDSNVAQDLEPPRDARLFTKRVRPFTKEELRQIVAAAREAWRENDDRFMLLLAAIYTGARLEELAQLGKTNLKQEGDIWFLDIDDLDGRQIKNESSLRCVPLHPDLIAAGFVDHARKSKGPLLFQSFTKTAGRYGHNVSNAFHRLLRDRIGITDRTVRWHAIRHAFADACREAGVPEDVRHRLMGHVGANRVAERYGSGHKVKTLAEWMQKIEPL
jgi:site-specific recombinase XerD